MHGEYKVPGGKLVVADLDVADEVVRRARISGDFFLEPDDALELIDGALAGFRVGASVAQIAARVRGVLGDGVEMIGFSPEAVTVAVRRALTGASAWPDHAWEFVHDVPRAPALRIWEWAPNAVLIGSFQSLANEVDLAGAAKHDVTVVRRISGGGAMFVEPGNTITYSLYVPESLVSGLSFVNSYALLDDWVVGALNELGIAATYQPINDITSPAGKIAGAAQKRFAGGAVLHHVTMAYDMDATKMLQVLRIGREKLSDKGTTSANKRVDPPRSQTGLERGELIKRLVGRSPLGTVSPTPGSTTRHSPRRTGFGDTP